MNEIEYIKVQTIKKRQEIDYYNNLNKNSSNTYLSEKDKHLINLLEKELHHLQQIKTILEAWEIVKNKSVDLYDIKTSQDTEEFNCDLYKDYQLNEEEFNKLKNALEV